MSEWAPVNVLMDSRLDRPASTMTALRQKEAARQEILSAVELYLAQGGKITVLPNSSSKTGQLTAMRSGEVELIRMGDIAKRWKVSIRTMPAILAKWPSMMYILDGTERLYSLEDIQRVEAQPGYKLHKSTL